MLSLADSSLSNWHGPSPYTRVRYINSYIHVYKLLSPLRGARDCHAAVCQSVSAYLCIEVGSVFKIIRFQHKLLTQVYGS